MTTRLATRAHRSSWSVAMTLTVPVLLVMGTGGSARPSIAATRAWTDHEIAEVARSMDELPQSVVRTVRRELRGREALDIEEIRYEGIPILYEVEFQVDGREHEIAVRPNGELVLAGPAEPGDDDGEAGEDDDARGDEPEDHDVTERDVAIDDLPEAVADALRRHLGHKRADEIEEVRYEGIIVLYEAELADDDEDDEHRDNDVMDHEDDDAEGDGADEIYIYPYGTIATQEGDVIEREVAMDDLPRIVADALLRELGRERADEIEEIRYEGIPVLYEAELARGGQEWEVSVFPNGRLAQRGGKDQESKEGIEERQMSVRDLPRAVADTLKHHANGGEIEEVEEIRYDGIAVLYEAEVEAADDGEYELTVYPDGQLAERRRSDDDDEDNDDEDDEDDEDHEDDDEDNDDEDDEDDDGDDD